MIVTTMVLHDARDGHREKLATLHIVNDGTGNLARGNYDVTLYDRGENPHVLRHARVEHWDRFRPAWQLLQAAMAALGV